MALTFDPISVFCGVKMRDKRGESGLDSLRLWTSYNEHSTPHIMYKTCLVSWTLFLFCCTLMADASFCNYWTVLIVKIKCIQTKKWIVTERRRVSCFNFFISDRARIREASRRVGVSQCDQTWVNCLESSPSLLHKLLSLSQSDGKASRTVIRMLNTHN